MSTRNLGQNGDANAHETAHDALSDEQLMLEVQGGDGDAFTILFDRYNRLVLTVALRIVPAKGTLKVWLLQFAYHRSINRRNYLLLRQFYNRPDLDEAMLTWEAAANTTPRVPAQELKQVVEQALKTLHAPQRRAVEKVIFEGLTLREVAEQTGETYNVVRNNYYRGLDRLRGCLIPKTVSVLSEGPLAFGEVSRGKA